MAVRLLLDENLSERLLSSLLAEFPGSSHVRVMGKGGAPDTAITRMPSGSSPNTKTRPSLRLGSVGGLANAQSSSDDPCQP
ncbi:MAG: DUF5615 family PIN-like protein [Gemmatimonadaceae bacterium]|nr:DUF5615 family PIN-like protein [Gemmatimonadaceae bacterium]MBA3557146.1 DUF5615 family PIN-like protein [Gemmatimonadaceae bacterium]